MFQVKSERNVSSITKIHVRNVNRNDVTAIQARRIQTKKNIKNRIHEIYIKIYTNSSTIPTFSANDCYYSPFALVYTNDNIQNQRLAQNAQT